MIEFDRNMKALGTGLSSILESAAKAGGMPIQNAAKSKAPKRTRTLARGIHMLTTVKTIHRVWVAIGPREIYGRIQELGGTVRPKTKKILAWVTSGARPRTPAGWKAARKQGIARYALQVTIPAHPYMRPAFVENKIVAVAEAKEVLRRLIARVVPR